MVVAGAAVALAVVTLSSGAGSQAAWHAQARLDPGVIRSGNVSVTATGTTVQLHSRQPAGSRTFASSRTCAPDAGFVECREIGDTSAEEAVVPGDRVVVTDRANVRASGSNLAGTLEVRVGLTSAEVSAFSGAAEAATSVTGPGGARKVGPVTVFPVRVSSGEGVGVYTARTVITTPSAGVGAQYQGQPLFEGAARFTFTQSLGGDGR